jgi:endonuclease III
VKQDKIFEIFVRFRAANPSPKSDLEYTNPFTLLVAVVLSAQATDAGVNKATKGLFNIADTPETMAKLGLVEIKHHIKTIGLFNAKAENVLALSKILIEKFNGQIPRTREDLMSLPGVGRKTANVVLNIIYGEPTMAVDTHVFRLGNRLKFAKGTTPEQVEGKLVKKIPAEFMMHAHHWLILHGRYTCKARNPLCDTCIINDLCPSRGKV